MRVRRSFQLKKSKIFFGPGPAWKSRHKYASKPCKWNVYLARENRRTSSMDREIWRSRHKNCVSGAREKSQGYQRTCVRKENSLREKGREGRDICAPRENKKIEKFGVHISRSPRWLWDTDKNNRDTYCAYAKSLKSWILQRIACCFVKIRLSFVYWAFYVKISRRFSWKM